ncbi:cob(I)yrinic acid a,c-diamide adenosyltransferase [Candidatus Microgenomates bacterium]|nr:cob(I)yrinic acid a,c-diamide adenosyltransferase [Candidatus Microgenomates bacterium]
MILLFTGNGKGKTTATLGLALRASGWDKKVIILQFVKEESWPEGARKAIRENLPHITIEALGSGFVGIMGDKKTKEEHQKSARKALQRATEVIESKKYNIVILDEILGALHGELIGRKDMEDIIRIYLAMNSNQDLDLVLTGRNAPEWLIKKADLVTEMKEIKHPFQKGIRAKKGLDF